MLPRLGMLGQKLNKACEDHYYNHNQGIYHIIYYSYCIYRVLQLDFMLYLCIQHWVHILRDII